MNHTIFCLGSPLTGDTTSPWPLIVLVVAAIAVAVVLLISRKK